MLFPSTANCRCNREGLLNSGDMVNTCLYLKTSGWLSVSFGKLFKETGIYLVGGTGNGGSSNNLHFETVSSVTLLDGTANVLSTVTKNPAYRKRMFIDCRFDTTPRQTVRRDIRKATKTTFYRCHFARYNNASVVWFLTLPHPRILSATCFDCSVGNIKVIETESNEIGNHFFYGRHL